MIEQKILSSLCENDKVRVDLLAKEIGESPEDVLMLAKKLMKKDIVTVSEGFISSTEKTKKHQAREPCKDHVMTADEIVFAYLCLFPEDTENVVRKRFGQNKKMWAETIETLKKKKMLTIKTEKRLLILRKRHLMPNKEAQKRALTPYTVSGQKTSQNMLYQSPIDVFFSICCDFGPISLKKIAGYMGLSQGDLMWPAKILALEKILRIRYSGSDLICQVGELEPENEADAKYGELILGYPIEKESFKLQVAISDIQGAQTYLLAHPRFSGATKKVLEHIFDLARPTDFLDGGGQQMDFDLVKQSLKKDISDLVDTHLGFLPQDQKDAAKTELINELHLGRVEYLLCDPNIEEIKAQSARPVFVKHSGLTQQWIPTNLYLSTEQIIRYSKAIARETGQRIDCANPLMDAILHTKDRVNVSLPETTGGSAVMEIRVFSKRPWTFVRHIRTNTVSCEAMAFLWLAMENKLNILVAGETGCGKTSFVNSISLFLAKNDNIISIEDTREIQLPKSFKNWTHLTTRKSTQAQDITMSRLLINALRMDPSFIILGEVRSREDILTLMSATAMGHPIISTIHSRDSTTTVKRIMDSDVSRADLEAIHLNVVLEAQRSASDPTKVFRKVKEISEYDMVSGDLCINKLFRLDHRRGDVISCATSKKAFWLIRSKTGMSQDDLCKQLARKTMIIQWLVRWDVDDIEMLSDIIQLYYMDRAKLTYAALDDIDPKEVRGYEPIHEPAVSDAIPKDSLS